ncbi:uncharacterized protein EV420DRAFT_1569314 [Desarmillaria tabescens]|uniref:Uncharacterized protein n=1 Tax=Armillaria tabescens TaxID=1929756 RepID=A0AA39JS91_ARMTA|nr:uncharacterized protein EV420DRAFT_1569314 [Desarmillaria tabescens]KAK0447000.1 hypothetical protein EV420DRAFT_1569314 [Desarmillaria tabescens]
MARNNGKEQRQGRESKGTDRIAGYVALVLYIRMKNFGMYFQIVSNLVLNSSSCGMSRHRFFFAILLFLAWNALSKGISEPSALSVFSEYCLDQERLALTSSSYPALNSS